MPIATDIDQALIERAREATGIEDTCELLNEGLRLLVRLKRQEGILELRGTIDWEGDLQEWRRDREFGNAGCCTATATSTPSRNTSA